MKSEKRIFCVVDGTKKTVNAENWAFEKCCAEGYQLDLLYVVDSNLEHYGQVDILATDSDKSDFIAYIQKTADREARAYKVVAERKFEDQNIVGKVHLQTGDLIENIVKLCSLWQPECIVVGGKSSFLSQHSSLEKTLIARTKRQVHRIA